MPQGWYHIAMISSFCAKLDMQESEDNCLSGDEKAFIAAAEREFSNFGEILEEARSHCISVGAFLSGAPLSLKTLPVRTSAQFYVKKHTSSQLSYVHSHDFYEIIYVSRGECVQRLADNKRLALQQGQCVIVCPQAVHSLERCRAGDIILKMVIPQELFAQCGGQSVDGIASGVVLPLGNIPADAVFSILKLFECQGRVSQNVIRGYLTVLFSELSRRAKPCAAEEELRAYLLGHMRGATLGGYAAFKGYSANYLSRLIKRDTGKSFSELLALCRMERAQRLLAEGDMPVEDISREVGYDNPSGFYKAFFRQYGLTPAQYRAAVFKT